MPARLRTLVLLSLAASAFGIGRRCPAAVVVLANHTSTPVAVEFASDLGLIERKSLQPGESAPFFSSTPATVAYGTGMARRVEQVSPDSIYRFAASRVGQHTGLQLRRVTLAGERASPPNAAGWAVGGGRGDSPIRVLLCVDDDEPTRDDVWKERLAKRLEEASQVLEAHSGVRFEIAGYARWRSDNSLTQFGQSLREFETSVQPPGNAVAIGFSSQYRVPSGRHRMGGTRGPLRRHVMLREWSPRVSEAERVELLVHELGHFLGAGHSPEPTSVMRPILGDRPVRLRQDVIRFDPVNTLAIAMVGEEVRRRGVRKLTQLSGSRRDRLQKIYTTLSALTPGEPGGAALLRRIQGVRGGGGDAVSSADRSAAAAARVVEAVTRAAAANQKDAFDRRLTGDQLTNHLVRAGAAVATDRIGLLLGLGVALDDSGALRAHPRTRALAAQAETDADRRRRLNVLSEPTARGRGDVLKHFLVTAALAAEVGEKEALLWGVGKELSDSNGGTGFSFADLAADRAGARFARGVLAGTPPISGLAQSFRVENYVPSLQGLEEGISMPDLLKRYGGQGDPRYDAQVEAIDQRIESLPAYSLLRLGLPGQP